MAQKFDSNNAAVPAAFGENTAGGDGITGVSKAGNGVHGISETAFGLLGESKSGRGVVARSETDYGLRAASTKSAGIRGSSVEGRGVEGWATNSEGVVGISTNGTGVWGQSEGAGTGVVGTSKSGTGVHGKGKGAGVVGEGETWHGVAGFSTSTTGGAGVWGEHKGAGTGVVGISNSGVGVHGKGNRLAGFFEGDIEVTGDIRLTNADCAEDFDIANASIVEAGTVMCVGEEGVLRQSSQSYDKRVAGVVSGAGDYKPGIVLDKQQSRTNRKPIALLGKVYCKVDASHAPVEVGDLLTTSPTPGHAMKATDQFKAFGAVIGKALRPLNEGQGLIPILIALQ